MKRRTFVLASLAAPMTLFLPQMQAPQSAGIQEFHCAPGEEALGIWYVSAPAWLNVDWHYLEGGIFRVRRERHYIDRSDQKIIWFVQIGPDQALQRVVWTCRALSWWLKGTCV